MHLGDAAVVTANEADQDLGIDAAGIFVDMPHDAEVIGDDIARGGHLQVALVHVGVEEPVAQRVAEEKLQHPFGQRVQVMPGGLQRRNVAQRDSFDPAQSHHPARGQVPDRGRHPEARIPFGVLGEFRGGGTFQPQVQLTHHHALEMVDDIGRPQAARGGGEGFDQLRGKVKGVDVAAKGALDPRPQHLDGDVLALARRAGAVDLRDGGGGDGFAEFGEKVGHRVTKLFLQRRDGDLSGEGRQLVLQDAKLVR